MKRILLITIGSLCLFTMQAQFKIDYHATYATYKMEDMKDFLNTIKISEPLRNLGLETVEDFPAYIAHSVNLGYRVNQHEFGIKSGFYSTGGKLSIGDYSGKINMSLTTNGFREGVYYRNYFYTYEVEDAEKTLKDRFSFWGEVSPSIIISTLKIKTILSDVELQEVLEEPVYNENAYALLFQLGGRYYITSNLSLDIAAGYDFSFGGKYEKLNGSPRSDWSGIRLTGGIGFSF